jgi:hypothetical protein
MLGILLLALAPLLIGSSSAAARSLHSGPAPAMRIGAFYPITKAAWTAWNARATAPQPVPTRAFSEGTTDVGYYFSYAQVVPHGASYEVVVYGQTGAPYITGNLHKFSYTNGEVTNDFGGGDPFDSGSYRMDLLLNGVVAASTTFSVGSATVNAAPISTKQAIGQRVDAFYPITMAAYQAWTGKGPVPAPAHALPRGTTAVGYYIAYQDMYPKRTSFQVVIIDHTGATYATGSRHPFPYVGGVQLSYFGGSPFENGSYRMDLSVNGIVVASVTFSVGA